jgi:hypothetical protein
MNEDLPVLKARQFKVREGIAVQGVFPDYGKSEND